MLLVLVACPKRVPEDASGGLAVEGPIVREVEPMRSSVPSPGTWRGAGLAMDIPPGWNGREGRGSGLLLALSRTDGVAMELWSFLPGDNVPFPRPKNLREYKTSSLDKRRSFVGLRMTNLKYR